MKTKETLTVRVKNIILYEKMNQILNENSIIADKPEKMDLCMTFHLIGENDEMIFASANREELMGMDLLPQNLYEISPFIFLYLLRTEDYALEVFHELRKCFLNHFPEITDGYEFVQIVFDSLEPVKSENDEEIGFCKQYKSMCLIDGKVIRSVYSNSETEEKPTPATVIFEKEKNASKVEADMNSYKTALDAFNIEDE